jgi:hypothetical protein
MLVVTQLSTVKTLPEMFWHFPIAGVPGRHIYTDVGYRRGKGGLHERHQRDSFVIALVPLTIACLLVSYPRRQNLVLFSF